MLLAREAKSSDPLGRYYTDALIGSHLITAMESIDPCKVIDLGAGAGILTEEGSKVWKSSSFFTVDIDARAQCASFSKTHGNSFKHFEIDALDLELSTKLGLKWSGVDAAICNPPYLIPKWKAHFNYILEDAGLRQYVARDGDISADILFLAQNLRMLKSGGKLGLIIPDSIITGEKYSSFRKALIKQHCIEKIIELPRRAFKRTDAKAHILVLSKDVGAADRVAVSALKPDGDLEENIYIPTEHFIKRVDYSYLKEIEGNTGKRKIEDVSHALFRGTVSSAERKSSDIPVFHTTDFKETLRHVPGRFHISSRRRQKTIGRFAEAGDILIARVGRNLSTKICMVKHGGFVAISDCILVIRVDGDARDQLFDFLSSDKGRTQIKARAQGVGAQFITPKSLLELKF
jgi:type I restriction enzyme M protein